jgi:hypothetical protein
MHAFLRNRFVTDCGEIFDQEFLEYSKYIRRYLTTKVQALVKMQPRLVCWQVSDACYIAVFDCIQISFWFTIAIYAVLIAILSCQFVYTIAIYAVLIAILRGWLPMELHSDFYVAGF